MRGSARSAVRSASSSSLGSWRELEPGISCTRVPKPWKSAEAQAAADSGAVLVHARAVFPADVMARARALLPTLEFDRDPDSVDGRPTFEIRWAHDGKFTHAGLAAVFGPSVEARLLPMLRRTPLALPTAGVGTKDDSSSGSDSGSGGGGGGGGQLVLCQALLRVYDDGQRRTHPAHFDSDALVTAVIELDATATAPGASATTAAAATAAAAAAAAPAAAATTAGCAAGFEGHGFYVQPGAHVSTRVPLPMSPGSGDVVAHSFDLQHGVETTAGRRASVIFWFVDAPGSCDTSRGTRRPWLDAPAEAGDPDAQYIRGKCLQDLDAAAARPLLAAAAAQGHFMAQNDLGAMMLRGDCCEGGLPDLDAAQRWYAMSAAQGFHRSMVGLSDVHRARGDLPEALRWWRAAAEQRADPAVLQVLGEHYLHGTLSAAPDVGEARKWVREAAELGLPDAQLTMAELCAGEAREDGRREAEQWLQRAANQGHPAAVSRLARQLLRSGEIAKLAKHVAVQAKFRAQLWGLGGGSKWTKKHTVVACGLFVWYPMVLQLLVP